VRPEPKAELGFAFTNEVLSVRGVEFVGPFPPELRRYILFTAGVATAAEQPEAAKAQIEFLGSPAAVCVPIFQDGWPQAGGTGRNADFAI
jgi:molybdate transport system substrate-binding protein